MPRPILYSSDVSPPCRAVLLAAEVIGLDLEIREVNLLQKENLNDDFVKINPQHTIPTLNDDGFILWDSHAIICYLVGKYGKNDALYPKDLQKRALIDQRLHFDTEVLFATLRSITKPLVLENQLNIPNEKLQLVKDAYVFMDKFLEGKKWLVGDSFTLADISCVATFSSLKIYSPIDKYSNAIAWLKRCEEELPGYATANAPGNAKFHALVGGFLKKL